MKDMARKTTAVTKEQVVEAASTLRLDSVYFLKGVQVCE